MNKIALYTRMGHVQYHDSIDGILAEYNKHGTFYEVKNGKMYHKASKRIVGDFRKPDPSEFLVA